jgi:hypothetical protein
LQALCHVLTELDFNQQAKREKEDLLFSPPELKNCFPSQSNLSEKAGTHQ